MKENWREFPFYGTIAAHLHHSVDFRLWSFLARIVFLRESFFLSMFNNPKVLIDAKQWSMFAITAGKTEKTRGCGDGSVGKVLAKKHTDVWIWIPKTDVKPGTVGCVCNLNFPIARWEAETGGFMETAGPARLAYRTGVLCWMGRKLRTGTRGCPLPSCRH